MIFTKIKGNLGKWPQDIPVLRRTMVAHVKNPLARRSHFDHHNQCHIGGNSDRPFCKYLAQQVVKQYLYGDHLRRNA